ncbi:MAG TPA: prepilin-type N-terminal cleavage/methylation domain-containing protein [Dongiaceae bacterium]|nr:prepilin-type N-terminal cleavage/methylation domain-containing protein [Dongiaceae bacterium]
MRFHSSIPSVAVARRRVAAFTLIELLVVISIIALLAAVGLPALKGFGKSNAINAADRQMLDDLQYARLRAMTEHTTVYVVFVYPGITAGNRPLGDATLLPFNWVNYASVENKEQLTNILHLQASGYALYVGRSVGDQPGQAHARYLTPWQKLPDGIFVASKKFQLGTLDGITNFNYANFPFPTATNVSVALPYVAFNYLGQLEGGGRTDGSEVIPLARGSVLYNADLSADILEAPAGNSATNSTMWNHIRVDGLTGRARVEQLEIP